MRILFDAKTFHACVCLSHYITLREVRASQQIYNLFEHVHH